MVILPDAWQRRQAVMRTLRPDAWQRRFRPPVMPEDPWQGRFIDRPGPMLERPVAFTPPPMTRPPLMPEEEIVGPGPAGYFGPGGEIVPNAPVQSDFSARLAAIIDTIRRIRAGEIDVRF